MSRFLVRNSSVLPVTQQSFQFPGGTAYLGLACLLALSACAPVQVRMGRKVYIDKTPISSMQVSLPRGPGIAPGEKLPLVVTLTAPDGTLMATEGAGHGKVLWKDIQVTASVVHANRSGDVSLPRDPRSSDGKVGHVTVTVPNHPDLRADLDIPLRYDHDYSLNFSGNSGFSGQDGNNGLDGMSGSSGSSDPAHPSAGGNGTDGGHGSDGQRGGAGGDGPPVQLRVALRPASESANPLLQVAVSASGQETLFLIDPQGGSLTVKTEGGTGGAGGKGGRGGRGGSGGIGTPSGQAGHDGLNGSDGSRGWSGRGGNITVIYDPQAQPYLSVIHLLNPSGPTPAYHEEPVAPLW